MLETLPLTCPKIRGLHLRMCEMSPELEPYAFDNFNNLTHFVIDELELFSVYSDYDDDDDGEDLHIQFQSRMADSFSKMLIRSPQLRELGLKSIASQSRCFFVLLSDAFVKNAAAPSNNTTTTAAAAADSSSGAGVQRLRLRSLLLGNEQYPPGPSPIASRYITQLTDPHFLRYLHIGCAGCHLESSWIDEAVLGEGPDVSALDNSQMVRFPSFISPESTPNLRRLSASGGFNEYTLSWMRDLQASCPGFAQQLSIHCPATGSEEFEGDLGVGGPVDYSGISKDGYESEPTDEAEDMASLILPEDSNTNSQSATSNSGMSSSFQFRTLTLHVRWNHPGRTKLSPDLLATYNRAIRNAAAGRESHHRPLSLKLYLVNHGGVPHTRCIWGREVWTYKGPKDERGVMIKKQEMLNSVGETIVSLFQQGEEGPVKNVKELHIPLGNSIDKKESIWNWRKEWNMELIRRLADPACLPDLRFVKLYGPAYEVFRDGTADGRVKRIVEMDRFEEREIELFRRAWDFWWP